MKKSALSYFLIGLFLSFTFISCGEKKIHKTENMANIPAVHTLIFIDKTASVDVSKPFVAQKYEQALRQIIDENISQAGDKFEIYYIHENTAKARCLSLNCRTKMENTEGMNATDLEATKTLYALSIRKERSFMLKQATTRLNAKNENISNRETNILASIPLLAKTSETSEIVKVYYFSDMVESVKSGRDFQIKPPKDSSEAEKWAITDAKKYRDLTFNNIEISMILPFEPTSSSKENDPTITLYWSKLFENLGISHVQEL
jgi:hypothetical protein